MTIRDYIRDQIFSRRAKDKGILAIYDSNHRYREIATSMTGDTCRVIDVSESIILQREAATVALAEVAEGTLHQLILWIPTRRPENDEEKQRDPFSIFAEIGDVFPKGDGDEYLDICRRAKPDHVSELNRLFDGGEPSFEMVDALEQGGSWPKLKTLLRASSPKEILIGLMSPNAIQEKALHGDGNWHLEVRDFVARSLGHKLKTKGKTQQSIGNELWRVLLFSEFYFDSAGDIPSALETVPRGEENARALVFDVCESLRRHDDHKDLYRSTAEEIEKEMQLESRTQGMKNLGERDTFACEERIYLQRLIDHVLAGEIEQAHEIWQSRQRSIWLSREDRMAEWSLAARAIELLDIARSLPTPKFPSLGSILQGYASIWRELDRHHREMEQAANQIPNNHDGLNQLLQIARNAYRKSIEGLQAEFIRLVQAEGWPLTDGQVLWNRQVFSKKVDPLLKVGHRVAYFLIDSLRYELGVELEKQLSDKFKVDLELVCAQLPTYTEVGMASLMPNAEANLSFQEKEGKLVTTLDGVPSTVPSARFAYLQRCKGDQCFDIDLESLVRKSEKQLKIPAKATLVVVRTTDIDTIAHDSPHQVLDLIPSLVRNIIRGIVKVGDLGFDHAVVATDHGFILFHEQAAGDLCPKPPGNWLVQKARCLLGEGEEESHNLVLKASEFGIPGNIRNYAVPKTLAPYSRGQIYYHEGLSLQECVLPCLTIKLESESAGQAAGQARLTLSYRQGKIDKITSRRPVVDLAWPERELFVEEWEREVAIEAVDGKGNVVGEVASSQLINPATGFVRIKPGSAVSVAIRMDDNFSGSFKVRVLDPTTNATLTDLALKTAYLE